MLRRPINVTIYFSMCTLISIKSFEALNTAKPSGKLISNFLFVEVTANAKR